MSASDSRFGVKCRAVLAATAVLAGGLLVSAAPAQAWSTAAVSFTGHGYGHGRGMGQWGAYGYAVDYGWNYTQILNHYYGGTSVKAIGLAPMTVDLSALDGLGSVTVSSGAPFSAGGVAVPANGAAKITFVTSTSFRVQTTAGGCAGALSAAKAVTTGAVRSSVAVPTTVPQLLTVCSTHRAYRGTLTLLNGSGQSRVVNTLSMDDYLKGVVPRESPAYWGDAGGGKGMAALQAQAVAARSYAAVSNRYSWARICDSQNCQVYGGAGSEGTLIEDARTNTAVTSTSAKVLVNAAGNAVSAEYSSSSGGWTAGGTFPAVEDLGDQEAPDHDWSASIPAATVGATFGVGTLTAITVTRNGHGADGGRVLTVRITGTAGTDTETGSDFASELALKSDWFVVHAPSPPATNYSRLYYANSITAPKVDVQEPFGHAGDIPLACDWDGNGTDTGGVYRAAVGTFYYRNTLSQASPLLAVNLGRAGDIPVCGDWDGNGTDTPGVYDQRSATFFLINTNHRLASTPLISVTIGGYNAVPIAGDWDGNHKTTVGVWDPVHAAFYLINSLAPGAPRLKYQWGKPGNVPLAGDWDGDGRDTIGVFQNGNRFAYTNNLATLATTYVSFGLPGDKPIVGDWNNDRRDTIGVGRGY